jgi:hypothetical protein
MTDRTFLQCQAFELRRLLVECGEDPVLAPQFQDRLREVEERLAQPEEEPRPDCYRWRLLAKSSDHKRQLGLETEEYQAGKERGGKGLAPLVVSGLWLDELVIEDWFHLEATNAEQGRYFVRVGDVILRVALRPDGGGKPEVVVETETG